MVDRKNLPLSALRAFESAARHLHLGRAGEELGVTHGAVSHQIRLLEERLDISLFSRAHNRLSLTPAGVRLLEAVTEGFDRILEGARYLDPDNLSGPLTIACTQTIASSWAAKAICSFYEKYPTITLFIREIQPLQRVIPRDVDVAICYGRPEPDDRKIIELGAPALYPVISPMLLSKAKPCTRPADVLDLTLIHDHHVSWKKWLRAYEVSEGGAASNLYFPNTSLALRAAVLGAGVALANTLESKDFIEEGQLVRLIDKPIDEEQSYYLLSTNGKNRTIKIQILEEWIEKFYN